MRDLTVDEIEVILKIAKDAACDRDGNILQILVDEDHTFAKVVTLHEK